MYCSNCGAKINENAIVCVKCGAAVDGRRIDAIQPVMQNYVPVPSNNSGAATGSLVLGIISVVFSVITFFIAMGYYTVMEKSYHNPFSVGNQNIEEAIITILIIVAIPGIMSIIGLFLGVFAGIKDNKGAKIAGIILNLITIVLCVIPIVLVASL